MVYVSMVHDSSLFRSLNYHPYCKMNSCIAATSSPTHNLRMSDLSGKTSLIVDCDEGNGVVTKREQQLDYMGSKAVPHIRMG